jgi:alkylglycerol monooxygenase
VRRCAAGTPLTANLQVYRELWALSAPRHELAGPTCSVWLQPPGWRPAGVAARWPQPDFDLSRLERFDPPQSRARLALAAGLFVAVLAATSVLLWHVHQWPPAASVAAGVLIVAVLCGVAALTSGPGSARRSTAPVRA